MNDAEETKENISKLTDKINDLEEKINAHQNREDLLLQYKEKYAKPMSKELLIVMGNI